MQQTILYFPKTLSPTQPCLPVTTSVNAASRLNPNFPKFWPLDPAIWLDQLESYFLLSNVHTDSQKYHLFVTNAEPQVLLYISDLMRNVSLRSYEKIKQRILQVFSKTILEQLQTIVELYKADKPSKIINAMMIFAAGRCSEAEVKNIFLRNCRPEAKIKLKALNLSELSDKADKEAYDGLGILKQDQSKDDIYTLNQVRDLLRNLGPRL